MHGEVDLAVGTGGYRSAYVRSDFPVGKTGTLSVAVQDSRINLRGDPIQHQGLGLGLSFAGAGPMPSTPFSEWKMTSRSSGT